MPYYVYLLASRKHGTLYVGMTSDLVRRVYEHKAKAVPGFTSWCGVYPVSAITREKDIHAARRMRAAASAKTWAPSTMSSSALSSDQ